MLDNQILVWLQTISSWYIVVPLVIAALRWKTHDVVRRRVAWYVVFNLAFTAITLIVDKLGFSTIFTYYIASPLLLWMVYLIFEPQIGTYPVWKIIKWLVIGFTIFVAIDAFWIEDFIHTFPNNIYPPQEVIIVFIVYYFLYIFSKEARQDFSSLWVSVGIGASALIIFFILVYFPYLGFKANTFGYFIWMGLGSMASIISYSCISYGLWIARAKH